MGEIFTPAARREAVAYLMTNYEASQRRACEVVRAPRSVIHYQHRCPDNATLRARLKELANERRRFGSRRLNQMLNREETALNLKKVRRLYAEERLQVKRRKGRKKASGTRAPLVIPQAPNQRRPLDVVSDVFTFGRRFTVMTAILRSAPGRVADRNSLLVPERDALPARAVTPRLSIQGDSRKAKIAWRNALVQTSGIPYSI